MKPLEVLFVGFGETPYDRDFLNHLHSENGVRVTSVRDSGGNKHVGAGVLEITSGRMFADAPLTEVRIPPRRWLGLSDLETAPAYLTFQDLPNLIRHLRPQIIVATVNYQNAFAFDRELRRVIKSCGSQVVFHSIPFQLPEYARAMETIVVPEELPLRSWPFVKRIATFLGLSRLYLKYVRTPALKRTLKFRRRCFQSAAAHAVYHEGGRGIFRSYGIPAEKIHVVRNSPNTPRLLTAADHHLPQPRPNWMIHVGRLVEWKRVDLLIRSLARLRSNGFSAAGLTVIGTGPCETGLRRLVEKLGLTDAVEFTGGVYDPDELAQHFSRASLYVLAGMGGLSINEAMCFRMPVVCCVADGTEHFLVREGQNGRYFEDGNEDDFVRVVSSMLSDEARLTRMGSYSRTIIETELNTQIHVGNYVNLFRQLISKETTPPC